MREKKPVESEHKLRITNQARISGGMMYELRQNEHKLVLAVSPNDDAESPGPWRVQASTERSPGDRGIIGWGTSKREALSQTGLLWNVEAEARELPVYDWEAVATALSTVRAL